MVASTYTTLGQWPNRSGLKKKWQSFRLWGYSIALVYDWTMLVRCNDDDDLVVKSRKNLYACQEIQERSSSKGEKTKEAQVKVKKSSSTKYKSHHRIPDSVTAALNERHFCFSHLQIWYVAVMAKSVGEQKSKTCSILKQLQFCLDSLL